MTNSRREKVFKRKELHAAILQYPPFSFMAVNVAFGLQVRMLNRVCLLNDLRPKYTTVRLDQLSSVFDEIGADCMFPIFPTPGREQYGDIVARTHRVGLGALIRVSDEQPKNIEEVLEGKHRIVVAAGEVGDEYLFDLKGASFVNGARVTRIQTESLDKLELLVRERVADIAIVDGLTCHRAASVLRRPNDQLLHVFKSRPLREYPTGIMIPKADEKFGSWIEHQIKMQVRENRFLAYEKRLLRGVETIVTRN